MDFFINRNGLQLAYRFNVKNPEDKDIYIVCHGLGAHMDFLFYPELCEKINVNSFRFDFAGNGRSGGEFTWAGYLEEAEDLNDAVNYLVNQGYNVKGVIGHSKGGNVVIIYAGLYGNVTNVIAMAPRFDMTVFPDSFRPTYEEILKSGEKVTNSLSRSIKITLSMVQERLSLDMRPYCHSAKAKIFILHGTSDDVIPYSDSIAFTEELGVNCKGHYSLDCNHFFDGHLDEAFGILNQIIKDN